MLKQIRLKPVLGLIAMTLLLGPFQNCGQGFETANLSVKDSNGQAAITAAEIDSFKVTLQPFLRTNCSACHGAFQQPMFAVEDASAAVAKIREYNLVNLLDPPSSRFRAKILSGHNGFPAAWADEVTQRITEWAAALYATNVDSQDPAVMILSPAAGTTVQGTILLSAMATDNVGVAGVTFQIDGVTVGTEDTVAPYEVSTSTLTLSNSTHQLTAIARDTSNRKKTSAVVSFTVNNAAGGDTMAPTVTVTAPAGGTMVSGNVTLTATATDNVGVASVQFYVNGVAQGAADTTAPYSVVWNTAGLTGTQTITARALDAAGNQGTSAAVMVTIQAANTQATYTWLSQNIFQPKCVSCHQAGNANKGVRLDTYAEVIKNVVPNSPSTSLIYTVTASGAMPRGGTRLTTAQLKNLNDWIAAGALNN